MDEKTIALTDALNNFIKELKNSDVIKTKKIGDTYHTIGDLYNHRLVLFSVICNQNKDIAWKSMLHSDDTMFEGMFIVGITTPMGQATYHYNLEYWDLFHVKVIDNAPEWDGHTSDVVLERLKSLEK